MNLLVQSGVTELFRYTCFCGGSHVQDIEMSALDTMPFNTDVDCVKYTVFISTQIQFVKKKKKQLSWYGY